MDDAFPWLDQKDIRALEEVGMRRSVQAGEYLYRQGNHIPHEWLDPSADLAVDSV